MQYQLLRDNPRHHRAHSHRRLGRLRGDICGELVFLRFREVRGGVSDCHSSSINDTGDSRCWRRRTGEEQEKQEEQEEEQKGQQLLWVGRRDTPLLSTLAGISSATGTLWNGRDGPGY